MKLARVQKQTDIEKEVLIHGELLKDKGKKEELIERIKEREAVREEEKKVLRQSKGKMRI